MRLMQLSRPSVFQTVVLASWLLCAPWCGWGSAAERADATVLVPDVLTSPGKEVRLRARVVRKGLLGLVGLGGEQVEFIVQGQSIGTSMTGGDGWAYLSFTPKMRGNHTVTVRVIESPRVKAAEGTALLASWERRKPILVIDIRATMKNRGRPAPPILPGMSSLAMPLLDEPDPLAASELEKVGRFYYNLLYVMQSESMTVLDLQQWLRQHRFPPGIPRVIGTGEEGWDRFLAQLQDEGWENIGAGIGLTPDFATVFVRRRIQAIVLGDPDEREGYPRRTVIVESWQQIRKHL